MLPEIILHPPSVTCKRVQLLIKEIVRSSAQAGHSAHHDAALPSGDEAKKPASRPQASTLGNPEKLGKALAILNLDESPCRRSHRSVPFRGQISLRKKMPPPMIPSRIADCWVARPASISPLRR